MRLSTFVAMALVLPLSACFPEKVKEPAGKALQREVFSEEGPAVLASWLGELASDPTPIVALAESNEGWGLLFNSKPKAALKAFQRGDSTNLDVQIGQARAALELARTFHALEALNTEVTRALLSAQSERPGSSVDVRWAGFAAKRLGTAAPKQPAEPPTHPGEVGLQAMTAAAPNGKAGDIRTVLDPLPDICTPNYGRKLKIQGLLGSGKLSVAQKLWERLDLGRPDVVLEKDGRTFGFRDPALAGLGRTFYASLALDALRSVQSGWPSLLKAEANILLSRWTEAQKNLASIGPGVKPPSFSLVFLSPYLDGKGLKARKQSMEVEVFVNLGQKAKGVEVHRAMETTRVDQRVESAYAGAVLGVAPTDAFPEDRGVLTKVLTHALTSLGDGAKGISDLDALEVVDRFVDGVQRRYADTLRREGRTALAAKHRSAAEDKVAAMSPSRRNNLSALIDAALENYGIDRPRVALKYLTRLNTRVTSVVGPSELLRELLSYRALEKGGGVSAGQ